MRRGIPSVRLTRGGIERRPNARPQSRLPIFSRGDLAEAPQVHTDTGSLVAQQLPSSGAVYYYLYDGLGSVVNLIDASGAAQATYAYDVWGNATTTTGTASGGNPFRYVSGTAESGGLIKFGTRYYDPTHGRWTQQDPTRADMSAYVYVDGGPTNRADPSGRVYLNFGLSFLIFTGGVAVNSDGSSAEDVRPYVSVGKSTGFPVNLVATVATGKARRGRTCSGASASAVFAFAVSHCDRRGGWGGEFGVGGVGGGIGLTQYW